MAGVSSGSDTRMVIAKKWVASVLVLAAFGAFLWTTAAQAFEQSGSHGFQQGRLDVRFTDRAGQPQDGPMIVVANGYPGMPTVTRNLTIGNAGSLPASYTLGIADLPESRP